MTLKRKETERKAEVVMKGRRRQGKKKEERVLERKAKNGRRGKQKNKPTITQRNYRLK